MLAQASTGLIETWWVSRLGTDALTGMALVFPGFMMMAMLSAGAVGGGISSAVARALGGGRRADADALVAARAPDQSRARPRDLGAVPRLRPAALRRDGRRGGSLDAAMKYSNVVFAGNVLVWLTNALASIIRGTGNMLFPSLAICVGVALLVPLSPLLIFGWGRCRRSASPAAASRSSLTTALTMAAMLAWYILSGAASSACAVRAAALADVRRHPARRRRRLAQHPADDLDRGALTTAWSAPPRGPRRSPATAPARGSNIC